MKKNQNSSFSSDNPNKAFDIVIVGVGGQGLITLTRLLAVAAIKEGLDVKTSELHGLSQRGGSIETHIRFGPTIYSPLVRQAGADLIISLELQEAFRASYYSSPEDTIFLVNYHVIPIITDEKVTAITRSPGELKKFAKRVIIVPATKIVEKEIGNSVVSGIFLLSLAIFKGLIPLSPDSLQRAMEEVIPKKYLRLNKKAFYLARQSFLKKNLGG